MTNPIMHRSLKNVAVAINADTLVLVAITNGIPTVVSQGPGSKGMEDRVRKVVEDTLDSQERMQ